MNDEAKVASFHPAGHRVYTESVDMPITMEEDPIGPLGWLGAAAWFLFKLFGTVCGLTTIYIVYRLVVAYWNIP
jgi:hypothetical protein